MGKMPNSSQDRLCGLVAAAFTPLNEDRSLNLDVIDDYVNHLHQNQVLDVFICGTTGEGMSLTVNERKQLAEKWIEASKDKLDKVIVQVGAHNLVESQILAEHAQKIGATAIAALPSLFFKPNTVDALVEYCKEIARFAPDLPFYYYHFPHFTDVRVCLPAFFAKAESVIPNLAGVKFQSSHLGDAMMVNSMHNGIFQVMMACDEVYLGAMAMGIDWAIGTTYSFIPNVVHRMIEAFNRGDIQSARAEQMRVQEVVNLRDNYSRDISVFKEILSMSGLKMGPPRLPLQPLTEEQRSKLKADLFKIGYFTWGKDQLTPPISPLKNQLKRRLHRRPLERATSLLTSDGDDPMSPKVFTHRCAPGCGGEIMHRSFSSSSEHESPHPHKPVEKRQSSTALLTE